VHIQFIVTLLLEKRKHKEKNKRYAVEIFKTGQS